MAIFLEDLKTYLTGKQFENIFCDVLPEQPDACIGLFLQNHTVPAINTGTGTRTIQIQVRDVQADSAYETAFALVPFLDSGEEETQIILAADRWCIGRPQTLPHRLSQDESGRVIYTFEITLWGENKP